MPQLESSTTDEETSSDSILEETEALLDEIDRLLDPETIQRLREGLTKLDDVKPFTLAMAMREGSSVTDQAIGTWTNEGETCALSAAMLSVRARGLA